MKQIQLKDKLLNIEACGYECPCHNSEYEKCQAIECPENKENVLLRFGYGRGFPDWCPLEGAPDPTLLKEEQMKVLKTINDAFVTIVSEGEKKIK